MKYAAPSPFRQVGINGGDVDYYRLFNFLFRSAYKLSDTTLYIPIYIPTCWKGLGAVLSIHFVVVSSV